MVCSTLPHIDKLVRWQLVNQKYKSEGCGFESYQGRHINRNHGSKMTRKIAILFAATLLLGCQPSFEQVQKEVDDCRKKDGIPNVLVNGHGSISKVTCIPKGVRTNL